MNRSTARPANAIAGPFLCLTLAGTLSLAAAEIASAEQQMTFPGSVTVHRDLPYADTENPRQTLDLFLPEQAGNKPLPVVVFIHGGAWRAGDKKNGRDRVIPFVATGKFAAASVGYRLSQEARWPAQIHDCKAAIRWLKANSQKHNLDGDRIAVWGTSAGGHLAAMLGASGDMRDLEGDLGNHLDQSSRVACVVDFYGPSELLTMNQHPSRIDHDAPDSPESTLIGGPLQEHPKSAANASPLTFASAGDPPFMIVHGTKDMAVPYNQSVRLFDRLRENGVDAALLTVRNGGHGRFKNPEIDRRVRRFLEVNLLGAKVQEIGGELPAGDD